MIPLPATARPNNWVSQYAYLGGCNRAAQANCKADSAANNWDYDLGQNMLTATFDTLYNSYDTTDLVITLNDAGNNNDHTAYVDAYYQHANVPDNGLGLTDCITPLAGDGTKCDHSHISYDPDALTPHAGDADFLKSVACHETGHQVGLMEQPYKGGETMTNADFACMRNDTIFPSNLGGHNAAHIDNHF